MNSSGSAPLSEAGSFNYMHLIKLVACKILQSFQSVFYTQCNFQKKKRFLASFLMGTFGDAGRSMFPAP